MRILSSTVYIFQTVAKNIETVRNNDFFNGSGGTADRVKKGPTENLLSWDSKINRCGDSYS